MRRRNDMNTKLFQMLEYYRRLDKRLRTTVRDTSFVPTMDLMKKEFESAHKEISDFINEVINKQIEKEAKKKHA